MDLLKSVGSALQKSVELPALDEIVEQLQRRFDQEIEKKIIDTILAKYCISAEEADKFEEDLRSKLNHDYDDKAQKAVDRKCKTLAEHWNDGGMDNLEVRKRILNRGFLSKKGHLLQAVRGANLEPPYLDTIVIDLKKKFVDEITKKISETIITIQDLTEEDAEKYETNLIDILNKEYDDKAQKVINRQLETLADQWRETSTDNLIVKKQVLNEGFMSRKGRLYKVLQFNKELVSKYD